MRRPPEVDPQASGGISTSSVFSWLLFAMMGFRLLQASLPLVNHRHALWVVYAFGIAVIVLFMAYSALRLLLPFVPPSALRLPMTSSDNGAVNGILAVIVTPTSLWATTVLTLCIGIVLAGQAWMTGVVIPTMQSVKGFYYIKTPTGWKRQPAPPLKFRGATA